MLNKQSKKQSGFCILVNFVDFIESAIKSQQLVFRRCIIAQNDQRALGNKFLEQLLYVNFINRDFGTKVDFSVNIFFFKF